MSLILATASGRTASKLGRGTALANPASNPDRFRLLLRDAYARRRVCTWIPLAPTGSMDPILDGQVNVLVRWGKWRPERGQIVLLAASEGILTVHRVILSRPTGDDFEILELADHYEYRNPYAGGWVASDRILGRIVAFRRSDRPDHLVPLDNCVATISGKLLAAQLALLWRLGHENAKWPNSLERLHQRIFDIFLTFHLVVARASKVVLRMATRTTSCNPSEIPGCSNC